MAQLDRLFAPAVEPLSLRELDLPAGLRVAVLAPHPDDFDAIGLTLRHLHERGHELHVAVLTTGASGVEDGFGGAASDDDKASLREAEQRASCDFFGLPAQRLSFLRLWGATAGADADAEVGKEDAGAAAAAGAPLAQWMEAHPADLLVLPHGNDSNRTHRRTFESVRAVCAQREQPSWACLNRDAKTIDMRVDLFFGFDEREAQWKAQLLRLHRSQQERNLRTRGTGFDERVLEVNRRAGQSLPAPQRYAEVFELARFGATTKGGDSAAGQ